MHHVLISYSRHDKAVADELAERLIAAGVPCWIDRRDIPCSVPWFDEIQSAIRSARLVVIVESLHWYTSQHCTVELSEAELWGVPVVRVSDDPAALDASLLAVQEALERLAPESYARTDLLVRAHDWNTAGRPRSTLARGSALRVFRRIAAVDPGPEPEVVMGYLRRSSRRRRSRRVWAFSLVLVLVGSVLGFLVIGMSQRRVANVYSTDLVTATGLGLFRSVNDVSPFRATDFALQEIPRQDPSAVDRAQADTPEKLAALEKAQPPMVDSFVTRTELAEALERNVPTLVAAPHGSPDPVVDGEPLEAATAVRGLVVHARVGDTQLRILTTGSGELHRLIGLPAAATALAFAPDGRTIAVAVGLQVIRYDLATGVVCQRLQGAVNELRQLIWSADARMLTASDTQRRLLQWTAAPGDVVLSDPARWFVGAAAVPGAHLVATLSREGRVDLVSTASAKVLSSQVVGSTPSSRIAASSGGLVAVLSPASPTPIALEAASGGAVRHLSTPGCHPNDISFDRQGRLLMACDEGVGILDVTSGGLRVEHLGSGDGAMSIVAAGGTIVVGSDTGNLETIDSAGVAGFSGRPRNCPGSARWLASTRSGSLVYTAGWGGGSTTCASRFHPGGTFPVGDSAPVDGHAPSTEAVAVSPNGSLVAYGYTDGSVSVANVETYDPVGLITGAAGSVRGVAFDDESRRIVFVTREGLIVLADLPLARLDGKGLMAAAQARVDLAVKSGLYTKTG